MDKIEELKVYIKEMITQIRMIDVESVLDQRKQTGELNSLFRVLDKIAKIEAKK